MFLASVLLAALGGAATIDLAEAKAMTPTELADRLVPNREPHPIADAIINGRGMMAPSESVNRVWLIGQMQPFSASACRSRIYEIALEPVDPAANPWRDAVATRPKSVDEADRLWSPPTGVATAATCAAAPARESGADVRAFGMARAATLVDQARRAFRSARRLKVDCRGVPGACAAPTPQATLAALDWSRLAVVDAVSADGKPVAQPPAGAGGRPPEPEYVRFTFPYAAVGGATWFITVSRSPDITAVSMAALQVHYE